LESLDKRKSPFILGKVNKKYSNETPSIHTSFTYHLTSLSSISMLDHNVVAGVDVESLTLSVPVVATHKLVLHAGTKDEHQVSRQCLTRDGNHKRVIICE